jgi:hypothetical protein
MLYNCSKIVDFIICFRLFFLTKTASFEKLFPVTGSNAGLSALSINKSDEIVA